MTITMRRNLVLAAALVALSVALILLDGRDKLDSLKGMANALVAPIGRSLTDLGDRASNARSGDEGDLDAQLRAVTAERDALLAENARLRELGREVEQLRRELQFQDARPELTMLAASVVARDPQSREKFLIINRGSNDGVAEGMAVVSPNFLVGQIVEVEPDRSKVLLTIDSGFQTGARLQLANREGIVYGRWQAGGRVIMRHVPVDVEIDVENELVVTSGKTERVPEGLVIGKVTQASKNELENETELEVLPLVDFDNLRSVTVIVSAEAP